MNNMIENFNEFVIEQKKLNPSYARVDSNHPLFLSLYQSYLMKNFLEDLTNAILSQMRRD